MDSVVAMVNFDMVGRLRNGALTLFGTSSSTDWAALVANANTPSLPLSYPSGLVASSDHWCFFEHARPVLFLHTGLHEQYHQPTDEIALIDTERIVQVGELAASLLIDLGFRPERLSFSGPISRQPTLGPAIHHVTQRRRFGRMNVSTSRSGTANPWMMRSRTEAGDVPA
jgi:Zn-dependent M28 family amino/carboxypeptidase